LEGSKGKVGLDGTKTKGRKMSHKWIEASLRADISIADTITLCLLPVFQGVQLPVWIME